MTEVATMFAKVCALGMVGAIFAYALKKDWDGVYLVFGLVFLLGSCQIMGVK